MTNITTSPGEGTGVGSFLGASGTAPPPVNEPLQFHPAADLFPLLDDADLTALAADIKKNGLHEEIWLWGKKILDGRNRYLACQRAGVKIGGWQFRYYGPNPHAEHPYDPIDLVLSANLHRRHLNPSQLAMVAEKVATMRQGARTDLAQSCAKSQAAAAKAVGVSRRQVQKAREVVKKAKPEDVKAIETGKTTIHAELKRLTKEKKKKDQRFVESERASRCITAIDGHLRGIKELIAILDDIDLSRITDEQRDHLMGRLRKTRLAIKDPGIPDSITRLIAKVAEVRP